MNSESTPSAKQFALLTAVTAAAIAVHGYHPYVEDAEIYVPGIKKALNPALYPFNTGFFASHAHLTLFPNLIAASVRITHLPFDWALLLWQFGSVFMLLLGCWHLGRLCFDDPRAKWGSVALVASLLTIPVAGTALYIMDQYVTSRALSTPAVLFLVINAAEKKFVRAGLWAVFTASVHPLMVVFGLSFVFLIVVMGQRGMARRIERPASALMLIPFFPPMTDAYRQVLQSRSYFFLLQWEWYEWVGIFAPLVIFWWFSRVAKRRGLSLLELLCKVSIVFGLVFFVVAAVITIPKSLARFAELQPMRSLHLLYVLLFIVAGGLLAQFVLKSHWWRWALLFLPIAGGMFYAGRQLFPDSPHLELPDRAPQNDWASAFLWIKSNTPIDAYFALDPEHMELPGEDQHGFRAMAERSMLADKIKDSGAVTMFPALAETWQEQTREQDGWKNFHPADFQRLQQKFGVNWFVLTEGLPGMACPYKNRAVAVCRLP
ncbi:MAG TPA: hypothetical protein VH088_14735 [Terriglobales bacterium]|jgi:hypothetical protein|nr:hypothetical protein [Terriglobales bacterium]